MLPGFIPFVAHPFRWIPCDCWGHCRNLVGEDPGILRRATPNSFCVGGRNHGHNAGEFIPQTLLGRSKEKVNSRQRIFSPLVTFWAFLAQVLERGSSCRDALQRISAWWQVHFPDQGSPSSDTSGYCQARARLDEAVLQQIGTHVAEQLERQVTNKQLWQGRRVKNCRWHRSVDARYGCQPAPVAAE